MIKAIVCGAAGRMGTRIIDAICATDGIELVAAIERKGHPKIGDPIVLKPDKILLTDSLLAEIKKADVIIDFSQAKASILNLDVSISHKIPVVIGTTGFNDSEKAMIKKAAEVIPLVFAPNFSIGINFLFGILEQIGENIPNGYDIEIVETHHRSKKDSPSGTALRMGEILAVASDRSLDDIAVFGRCGSDLGPKKKNEIGIHSVRCGDVVGEHTIILGGLGERIELTHKAHSRDTFAYGAVNAALFVVGAVPGLYNMQDVLFKKKE